MNQYGKLFVVLHNSLRLVVRRYPNYPPSYFRYKTRAKWAAIFVCTVCMHVSSGCDVVWACRGCTQLTSRLVWALIRQRPMLALVDVLTRTTIVLPSLLTNSQLHDRWCNPFAMWIVISVWLFGLGLKPAWQRNNLFTGMSSHCNYVGIMIKKPWTLFYVSQGKSWYTVM